MCAEPCHLASLALCQHPAPGRTRGTRGAVLATPGQVAASGKAAQASCALQRSPRRRNIPSHQNRRNYIWHFYLLSRAREVFHLERFSKGMGKAEFPCEQSVTPEAGASS